MEIKKVICPCKRNCVRHADCNACIAHHRSLNRIKLTTCERNMNRQTKNNIPSEEEIKALITEELYGLWLDFCLKIDQYYDMEKTWNSGGKAWKYEYKFRRGKKTLVTLYAGENCFGIMIIFGKNEREKFEAQRSNFSLEVQKAYDEAKVYHDGKWMMFMPKDKSMIDELLKALCIKRKPNKKPSILI